MRRSTHCPRDLRAAVHHPPAFQRPRDVGSAADRDLQPHGQGNGLRLVRPDRECAGVLRPFAIIPERALARTGNPEPAAGCSGFRVRVPPLAVRAPRLSCRKVGKTEPTPLRQVPLDRLADQVTGRTVLFRGRRLYFGKQTGRNESVSRGLGFHLMRHSRRSIRIKVINDFRAVGRPDEGWLTFKQAIETTAVIVQLSQALAPCVFANNMLPRS
jgi:hypothetical protein